MRILEKVFSAAIDAKPPFFQHSNCSSCWCDHAELQVRPRRVAGVTRLSRWCDFSESLVRQCRPTGATFSPMPLSIETGAFRKDRTSGRKVGAGVARIGGGYRYIGIATFCGESPDPLGVFGPPTWVSRSTDLGCLGRPTRQSRSTDLGTSVDRLGQLGRPTSLTRWTEFAHLQATLQSPSGAEVRG